jgi:hypothetical protein
MSERPDSQEVGLDAAILYSQRNSSLVKRSGADNSTGLKLDTEAAGACLRACAVGEHSQKFEAEL